MEIGLFSLKCKSSCKLCQFFLTKYSKQKHFFLETKNGISKFVYLRNINVSRLLQEKYQ